MLRASPISLRERAEALFFDGTAHMARNDLAAACRCFTEALALDDDFAEAHANLAFLLALQGQAGEAEKHYRLSIACNPDLAQVHLNLGVMLAAQKRFEEARQAYEHALHLDPATPSAWSNLGVLQACQRQDAAAEKSYRTALALDPEHRLTQFNLSYLLLRQGRFEEGWQRLQQRDRDEKLQRGLCCPMWQGESLTGKAILIGIEAGHGDMIQFVRYAALLKERGARTVGVLCHPGLVSLFATVPAIDRVFGLHAPLSEGGWDYWSPPLSLPYHCGTRLASIPASLPYLSADTLKHAHWARRLTELDAQHGRQSGPRIGLAWQGNPNFENDADRSLADLDVLAPLARTSGVRYYSLQKGRRELGTVDLPLGLQVCNLAPWLDDFAETAAAIGNLDLLITVDTAVAHLAGALGKSCWLLLPDYKTDWRWLDTRNDSPWYPEVMRLFRQPAMGDWRSVLHEVAAALAREFPGRQPGGDSA